MDGWEFPGGPGVRSSCFHCGGLGWIQSLVKEVRSCKSCGTAKKVGGGEKKWMVENILEVNWASHK